MLTTLYDGLPLRKWMIYWSVALCWNSVVMCVCLEGSTSDTHAGKLFNEHWPGKWKMQTMSPWECTLESTIGSSEWVIDGTVLDRAYVCSVFLFDSINTLVSPSAPQIPVYCKANSNEFLNFFLDKIRDIRDKPPSSSSNSVGILPSPCSWGLF